MKTKWRDIGIRAGKTFVQTFLGAVTIDAAMMTADRSVWRSMLLAAAAAGFSAAMNTVLAALKDDDD